MKSVLFVDDQQERHDRFLECVSGLDIELYRAYKADEALNLLREYYFDVVFLDHDLGHPWKDGTLLANTIVDLAKSGFVPEVVFVHSFNPVSARRMYEIFSTAGQKAAIINLYDKDRSWLEYLRCQEQPQGNGEPDEHNPGTP